MEAQPVVTLYSRQHCGPCAVALALLEAYAAELHFQVETVDVDGDPGLASRYGDRIPVAVFGEQEIASAPFRRSTVDDALQAIFGGG